MIIAFLSAGELHVIHALHQKGITKIHAVGLCTAEDNVGGGIFQVMDWAFDGRMKYGEIPVCSRCVRAFAARKDPPR